MLGLSLIFSFINAQRALDANRQLVIINERQRKDLETIQHDISDLKETILCIGQFFNSPNRQELRITAYSPCTIVAVPEDENPQENSTPPVSSQGQNLNSTALRITPSNNSTPTTQPPLQENPQPQPAPQVPEEPGVTEQVLRRVFNFIGGII